MKVGIDWGGTKIEAIVLDPSTGKELLRKRVDAPKENYVEIINTVFKLFLAAVFAAIIPDIPPPTTKTSQCKYL